MTTVKKKVIKRKVEPLQKFTRQKCHETHIQPILNREEKIIQYLSPLVISACIILFFSNGHSNKQKKKSS